MRISNRAKELRAAGRPVISFGAGEPDFATPDHIVQAAVEAARDPKNHKYSANAGLDELREAVARRAKADRGLDVDASQVLVTNGGKQAVFQALAALVDPGDEVIIPAPYWVTYPEAVKLAGGVPIEVPTSALAGFKATVAQLETARTPRTKALMFVSPSNPTGAVYDPAETRAIGEWAAEHGIWVISDDIYQYLVYGDTPFTSLPAVTPELDDRWVIIDGVSKTYAMTGWRVGWMIGPTDVVKAAANFQSHATSNVSNVSQQAALAALTGPQAPVDAMRSAFDARRRTMHSMLTAMPGVTCPEPGGAFYCFPSFQELIASGRFRSSIQMCEAALDAADVALVPGEAFGAPGHARLSYALGDDDLAVGLERLHQFLD
ncbi:MAG: pyridoxal phosphate-dependent aminotransferase [Acidimicrobiia bacterium]|nr:pyridoxal phosphate-dependent aminotransferase [Acidimicrobiia bacterium]